MVLWNLCDPDHTIELKKPEPNKPEKSPNKNGAIKAPFLHAEKIRPIGRRFSGSSWQGHRLRGSAHPLFPAHARRGLLRG